MPCHKTKKGKKRCTKRKKVVVRNGKRYYKAGAKSGWVRLKGKKKAPHRKR